MIGAALFRFARWLSKHPITGKVIGWGFQYGSWLIPVRRLVDTNLVTAFPHPKPSFDDHVLVIPKRAIATFLVLLEQKNRRYLFALLETAQALSNEWGWDAYSFGVNGGAYQDVRQVHFHLFRGQEHFRIFDGEVDGSMVFEHPNPRRASHQVIVLPINWQDGFDVFSEDLRRLIQTHSLMREGYTIFVQFDSMPEGCGLVLHLVSGERRHS